MTKLALLDLGITWTCWAIISLSFCLVAYLYSLVQNSYPLVETLLFLTALSPCSIETTLHTALIRADSNGTEKLVKTGTRVQTCHSLKTLKSKLFVDNSGAIY